MKVIRVTALLFLTFIVLTSAQDDIQEEISDEQLEDVSSFLLRNAEKLTVWEEILRNGKNNSR